MSDVQLSRGITERQSAINDAEKRMRSVDLRYMPVYPGGQKQFKEDCQVLAMAWMDRILADAKAAEVDGTVNVVALNRIYDAWMRLSGFATCVSAQGEYRVQIEYRSLEKAQDAYSALIEIGKVLQESQERLLFGITPKETT